MNLIKKTIPPNPPLKKGGWGGFSLLLVSCLLLLCSCDKTTDTGSGGSEVDASASLADCGTEALFTVSPVSSGEVKGIVPLGNLNPSGHVFPTDHIYFYTKSTTADVYSPGSVRITKIISTEYLSEDPIYTDYDIYFYPCKQFKSYFYHVRSLAQNLLDEIGSTNSSCETSTTGNQTIKKCTTNVSIDLSAGDAIGKAYNSLDFGAYDSRIASLPYANTSRFTASSDNFDGFHVVCPVDYFSTSVKSELGSKFGSYDGTTLRTVAPLCGEVEQDEPSTAQGKWYYTGASGEITEDPHLALVHDNVDPSRGVFSSGTSISNMYGTRHFFTPAPSGLVNLDFNKVTSDGNIYCYENLTEYSGAAILATILIQLPTSSTLKIEKQNATSCSSGPWSFSSPVEFER